MWPGRSLRCIGRSLDDLASSLPFIILIDWICIGAWVSARDDLLHWTGRFWTVELSVDCCCLRTLGWTKERIPHTIPNHLPRDLVWPTGLPAYVNIDTTTNTIWLIESSSAAC